MITSEESLLVDEHALNVSQNQSVINIQTKKINKKQRSREDDFRKLWVKYVKPKLKVDKEISKLAICREMIQCKELSLSRIKQIMNRYIADTNNNSMNSVIKLAKFLMELFDSSLDMIERFARDIKILKVWFHDKLGLAEEPKLLIPVKVYQEMQNRIYCLCFER
jgi:hypothetical protein